MQQAVRPAHGGARTSGARFGSDVVVDLLRELGIRYVALNPGASFRGLHDSLVNFESGQPPEILLVHHEEIAVAIAHGYARVTGKPMAAAVHNIVGLQHATMAIFNAWCDRNPVIVLGGTGPMDASLRRPFIDWVHTALVQGNQVRDYTKWDDQPASVASIPESMLRAYRIAVTEPQGPVYVCFDVEVQEEQIAKPLTLPDVRRFEAPAPPAPNRDALQRAAEALVAARWPVIIADTVGRNPAALGPLREVAELLGAPVVDRGGRFNFPTNHPLDLSLALDEALAETDVVLALDVYDLGGTTPGIPHTRGDERKTAIPEAATVIHVTLADMYQKAWSADYQILPEVDIPIAADTAEALPALAALLRTELGRSDRSAAIAQRAQRVGEIRRRAAAQAQAQAQSAWDQSPISHARLYGELWPRIKDLPWSLVNSAGRLSARTAWEITEPEQFLGSGGRGGGLGYALPGSIGAALAYKGSGRLCIAIVGDGEFLMTNSALWTAARYEIPLLTIMFNNKAYFQDHGHQAHMARTRERPMENVGIGIEIGDPDVDFATLARSYGVEGFGPVADPGKLGAVLDQAISVVQSGRPALVDVRTQPR
jgi:thiamine pyrophosphate-dependent acetolactate synthase large subunit-like protein